MAAPISIIRSLPGDCRSTTTVSNTANRTATAPPPIAQSTLESINSHPLFLDFLFCDSWHARAHVAGLGDGFTGGSAGARANESPATAEVTKTRLSADFWVNQPEPSKPWLPTDRLYDARQTTRHVNFSRGLSRSLPGAASTPGGAHGAGMACPVRQLTTTA